GAVNSAIRPLSIRSSNALAASAKRIVRVMSSYGRSGRVTSSRVPIPPERLERALEVLAHRVLAAVGHPAEDAKAEAPRAGAVGVVAERPVRRRGIRGVTTGDGLENQAAVVRAEGERTELVERPAERHRAVPAHPAVGRPQPGDPAATRGREDGAPRLRSDREGHEPGRDRGAGAARRAPAPRVAIPR